MPLRSRPRLRPSPSTSMSTSTSESPSSSSSSSSPSSSSSAAGVGLGSGVAVGSGVGEGSGVAVGSGVGVGSGVAVGSGVGVGSGSGVSVAVGSGEAVGGANGATRLSGNAITEAFVFGERAGRFAARYVRGRSPRPLDERTALAALAEPRVTPPARFAFAAALAGAGAWVTYLGLVRTATGQQLENMALRGARQEFLELRQGSLADLPAISSLGFAVAKSEAAALVEVALERFPRLALGGAEPVPQTASLLTHSFESLTLNFNPA